MKIFYHHSCSKNEADMKVIDALIPKFLNKELQIKKLKGHRMLEARINHEHRLLFSTMFRNQQEYLFILEVVWNHDLDSARFMQPGVLERFLEVQADLVNHAEGHSFVDHSFQLDALANTEPPTYEPVYDYNNHYLVFNDEQNEGLILPTPALIFGPPGSGKSCVLNQILNNQLESATPTPKYLYVAQSPLLVNQMKKTTQAQHGEQELRVDYLNIDDLFCSALRAESTGTSPLNIEAKAGFSFFATWYKNYPLAAIDAKMMYEEFRLISAFTGIYPQLNQNYYEALGKKHNLLTSLKEKKAAYALFTTYQQYLHQQQRWDPAFADLGMTELYDGIAVDEAMDLSSGQWLQLLKLSKNNCIWFTADSHQIQNDRLSHSTLWLDMLKKITGHEIEPLLLPACYRCPPSITAQINQVIALKTTIAGKTADRFEAKHILCAQEGEDGGVNYYATLNDDRIGVLARLTEHSAHTVVITRSSLKSKARDLFKTPLIYTPEEIKGLDYKEVILFDPLDPNDPQLQEINKLLDTEYRPSEKGRGNRELIPVLNNLLISLSRCGHRLHIIQKPHYQISEVWVQLGWEALNQAAQEGKPAAPVAPLSEAELKQSQVAWYQEAMRLLQQGFAEKAGEILREKCKYTQQQCDELISPQNTVHQDNPSPPLEQNKLHNPSSSSKKHNNKKGKKSAALVLTPTPIRIEERIEVLFKSNPDQLINALSSPETTQNSINHSFFAEILRQEHTAGLFYQQLKDYQYQDTNLNKFYLELLGLFKKLVPTVNKSTSPSIILINNFIRSIRLDLQWSVITAQTYFNDLLSTSLFADQASIDFTDFCNEFNQISCALGELDRESEPPNSYYLEILKWSFVGGKYTPTILFLDSVIHRAINTLPIESLHLGVLYKHFNVLGTLFEAHPSLKDALRTPADSTISLAPLINQIRQYKDQIKTSMGLLRIFKLSRLAPEFFNSIAFNMKDFNRYTVNLTGILEFTHPLSIAILNDDFETIKLLVNHGASTSEEVCIEGFTPRDLAQLLEQKKTIELFESLSELAPNKNSFFAPKPKPEAPKKSKKQFIKDLLNNLTVNNLEVFFKWQKWDPNALAMVIDPDGQGARSLYECILANTDYQQIFVDFVKQKSASKTFFITLFEQFTDVDGQGSMDILFKYRSRIIIQSTVEQIIDSCCEPIKNDNFNPEQVFQYTLYHYATAGKPETVRLLLFFRNPIFSLDANPIPTLEIPLIAALTLKHNLVVTALLVSGADVNQPSLITGLTPLEIAFNQQNKSNPIDQFLINNLLIYEAKPTERTQAKLNGCDLQPIRLLIENKTPQHLEQFDNLTAHLKQDVWKNRDLDMEIYTLNSFSRRMATDLVINDYVTILTAYLFKPISPAPVSCIDQTMSKSAAEYKELLYLHEALITAKLGGGDSKSRSLYAALMLADILQGQNVGIDLLYYEGFKQYNIRIKQGSTYFIYDVCLHPGLIFKKEFYEQEIKEKNSHLDLKSSLWGPKISTTLCRTFKEKMNLDLSSCFKFKQEELDSEAIINKPQFAECDKPTMLRAFTIISDRIGQQIVQHIREQTLNP